MSERIAYGEKAWAVRIRYRYRHGLERPFLAGRYYFTDEEDLPPSASGCPIALFQTRAEALEAAKCMRRNLGPALRIYASPVRVCVTVETFAP